MRAALIGSPESSNRMSVVPKDTCRPADLYFSAALLKTEPARILTLEVAANGESDRKTFTLAEICADGAALPQPRPIIVAHKLEK